MEKSNHWKGGIWEDGAGYIRVTLGNGKSRQQHRIIAEQILGRELTKDEVVHHINGIKSDNRRENLLILDRHAHHGMLVMQAYQARIQDLEAELLRIKGKFDSTKGK